MEIWKKIKGFESYEVSNYGNVKSLKNKNEKILKANMSANYLKVTLSENGKLKNFRIHQLVAICFLNHIPNNLKEVIDHKDSNNLNNHVDNLRIISHRQNMSKERTLKSGLPVGVSYQKRHKKYYAQIKINNKSYHFGSYNTLEEASIAYQNKLK